MSHFPENPYDRIQSLNAEVARLTAENERLSALASQWNAECDEMREDNRRLAAELAEAKEAQTELREALTKTNDALERFLRQVPAAQAVPDEQQWAHAKFVQRVLEAGNEATAEDRAEAYWMVKEFRQQAHAAAMQTGAQ